MKMTDEDVLRLAREAGILVTTPDTFYRSAIGRFGLACYAQGARDMQEATAKMCERWADVTHDDHSKRTAAALAVDIRALALPAGEPSPR